MPLTRDDLVGKLRKAGYTPAPQHALAYNAPTRLGNPLAGPLNTVPAAPPMRPSLGHRVESGLLNVVTLGHHDHPRQADAYAKGLAKSFDPRTPQGLLNVAGAVLARKSPLAAQAAGLTSAALSPRSKGGRSAMEVPFGGDINPELTDPLRMNSLDYNQAMSAAASLQRLGEQTRGMRGTHPLAPLAIDSAKMHATALSNILGRNLERAKLYAHQRDPRQVVFDQLGDVNAKGDRLIQYSQGHGAARAGADQFRAKLTQPLPKKPPTMDSLAAALKNKQGNGWDPPIQGPSASIMQSRDGVPLGAFDRPPQIESYLEPGALARLVENEQGRWEDRAANHALAADGGREWAAANPKPTPEDTIAHYQQQLNVTHQAQRQQAMRLGQVKPLGHDPAAAMVAIRRAGKLGLSGKQARDYVQAYVNEARKRR